MYTCGYIYNVGDSINVHVYIMHIYIYIHVIHLMQVHVHVYQELRHLYITFTSLCVSGA